MNIVFFSTSLAYVFYVLRNATKAVRRGKIKRSFMYMVAFANFSLVVFSLLAVLKVSMANYMVMANHGLILILCFIGKKKLKYPKSQIIFQGITAILLISFMFMM